MMYRILINLHHRRTWCLLLLLTLISSSVTVQAHARIRFPGAPGEAPQRLPASPSAAIPAFPGAEGFGAQSVGGRGGRVMLMTSLNDRGPGTLRACVEASGPRTCIFRTGGLITLESHLDITNPYITIAGQSAPGDGITVKAAESDSEIHLRVRTHDVIIRYLRVRPGTTLLNGRALTIANGAADPYNVIIDHSSFSWSGDELMIAWAATQKVTLQWNIFAESLPSTEDSAGLKGPNLGNDGGGFYSFHHNLMAHHLQRSPNISASAGPVDVVNNVVYNPGGIGSAVKNGARVNFVANYIKAGPNTRLSSYIKDELGRGDGGGFYVAQNLIAGSNQQSNSITFLPEGSASRVATQPYPAPSLVTTTAPDAYEQVLERAGAIHGLTCDGTWFLRRDPVDTRIIQSVRAGTRGHARQDTDYIRTPADVGGWPTVDPGTPCADSDSDGMPDQWETARGLNPMQDDSAADYNGDGYTNLEEYLNGMASEPETAVPSDLYLPFVER